MITVTALNTNYSEIATGEIDMTIDEFVRKNALTRNADGTYSAEWGNGEGEDTFEITVSE
jgi:hypothetical protein